MRAAAVVGIVVAAFAIAFGVAYLAGGDEGEAAAPSTQTQGLPEALGATSVGTGPVTVPELRAGSTIPGLRTSPQAPSGGGSSSGGGSAPSSGGSGGSESPATPTPPAPTPTPTPPGETIIVQ